jgi:hypothetical protein
MRLRNTIFLISASICSAAAQNAPLQRTNAELPAHAAKLSDFVLPGWKLEQQEAADLNGDGGVDALLLLRRQKPSGTPERVLAVALRERAPGEGYVLSGANDQMIPAADNSEQVDPMEEGELTARPGGFDVKLSFVASGGSYQMATVRYRFRFQEGCFKLIGYDRMETHRATMETRDVSINFITGLVIKRQGNKNSSHIRENRERLKSKQRPCFTELKSAADFHPV